MSAKASRRVTGGFSLDEAARLARKSPAPRACPICDGGIVAQTGADPNAPDRRVSLMRCGTCGKSLVLDRAETAH
jgi:hypothetical protein